MTKGGKPECNSDKIYELGVFVTFFLFLIFCKIKHSHYRGQAAKQSRMRFFFPNIGKPGLYFNSWRPLELPFVGSPQPAEVGVTSLGIFKLSVRQKRCKSPLEDCEGKECYREHSLLCCGMKEAVHWHAPERSWGNKVPPLIHLNTIGTQTKTSPHCNS